MSNLGPPIDLAQEAIKIALTQEGVREHPLGSNSGPEVNQYLACVGLPPGNSWCAALVSWCINEAYHALGGAKPTFKASGSALHLLDRNPTLKTHPGPNTIFVIDHGHGLGHTGFCISIDANGNMTTIEGNTNNGGSRQGDGVYKLTRRSVSDINGGWLTIA